MEAPRVLERIGERLERYKPTSLSVQNDTLAFEAGPMRAVLSSNLLVAISRGTVRVSQQGNKIEVLYSLRFNEIVLGGTLISFFLAYNAPEQWAPHLIVFVVFWFFFVGGNYLLSVHWFRDFLRKTLADMINE